MPNTRIIRQLPQSMINKIAAGEVIERPASVIKELIENSIDANAKRIEVIVEQAGTEMIKVVDDGAGMTEDQLLLALMPHATSKIADTDDLFKINTFGFRGEALASIAEISQLTLRSRSIEQTSGYEIFCNGGERSAPKPCGMPSGTQIEVKNLFFNTPVRRKYMKTTSTEFGHITEVFIRLAIPHPDIHFVLKHNSRTTYDLPPDSNILTRIKLIFGEDVSAGLVHIENQSKSVVRIEGYVSLPSSSRLNNKLQYLFLNSRFIRDRSLQHALTEAYRGLLIPNRFPVAFLNITMPPEQFDINVHPTKLEVRFLDSNRIYSGLLGAIREKFLKTDLNERVNIDSMKPDTLKSQNNSISNSNSNSNLSFNSRISNNFSDDPRFALDPNVIAAQRRNIANMDIQTSTNSGTNSSTNSGTNSGTNSDITVLSERSRIDSSTEFLGKNNFNKYDSESGGVLSDDSIDTGNKSADINHAGGDLERGHVVSDSNVVSCRADNIDDDYVIRPGSIIDRAVYSPLGRLAVQMHSRYLVLETSDGIAVIDQHALHERILYERLKEMMGEIIDGGKLESQRLLVPVPMDLSPAEYSAVMDNLELLLKFGLHVDIFGGETIIISSLPTIFSNLPAEEILLSLLTPLLDRGVKLEPLELMDTMLHSMACKAAIKAGERMSADSILKLISQYESEINSHHCPHGRPSSLIFTCEDLDKRFRR
ncbi:MAG: DNA mismatch repair endonuclease MutL [Planctomycetaceae bacterium]|jgi:DNA mismatch repair protein MutL|nr:DNA mismatch repair endonuclease MutL [Planctomycetaceae bacterium]